MHPRELARRNDDAHRRIIAATVRLAGQEAAERFASIHDRDPAIKLMMQRLELAAILESIPSAPAAANAANGKPAKKKARNG